MTYKDEQELLSQLNTDDDEKIEQLSERYPVLDRSAQKRIAELCEEKLNMRKNIYNTGKENTNSNIVYNEFEGETVSGVEVRSKTPWYRSTGIAVAASVVLVAGIGGALYAGFGNMSRKSPNKLGKAPYTTENTSAPETTEASTEASTNDKYILTEALEKVQGTWKYFRDTDDTYYLVISGDDYVNYVGGYELISKGKIKVYDENGTDKYVMFDEDVNAEGEYFYCDSENMLTLGEMGYVCSRYNQKLPEAADLGIEDMKGIWQLTDGGGTPSFFVIDGNSFTSLDNLGTKIAAGTVEERTDKSWNDFDFVGASGTVLSSFSMNSETQFHIGIHEAPLYTRCSVDTDFATFFGETYGTPEGSYKDRNTSEYLTRVWEMLSDISYFDKSIKGNTGFETGMEVTVNGTVYTAISTWGYTSIDELKQDMRNCMTDALVDDYSELIDMRLVEKDGVIYGLENMPMDSDYTWNVVDDPKITFTSDTTFEIRVKAATESGPQIYTIKVLQCEDGLWRIDSLSGTPGDN